MTVPPTYTLNTKQCLTSLGRTFGVSIFVGFVSVLLAFQTANAADDYQKLTGASEFSRLGRAVAISGNTAVFGAQHDDGNFGSAYIFTKENNVWVEQAKLTAADGEERDLFGHSVSIDGDTLAIGASEDADVAFKAGSVYVFVRINGVWSQQAKLTADDGSGADLFGSSVSVSGDTILVGATGVDIDGYSSGCGYVFERVGESWSQTSKLIPSELKRNRDMGRSVSLSGNTAVLGANERAYVFKKESDAWREETFLFPEDLADAEIFGGPDAIGFGASVSINGSKILVGARSDDQAGNLSGSAYLYILKDAGWRHEAKFTPFNVTSGEQFGSSVSLSEDTAILGSTGTAINGVLSGSAMVLSRRGDFWIYNDLLLANDGEANDLFGFSVATSGDSIIIGAPEDDDLGQNSGAGFAFKVPGSIGKQQPPTIVVQPEPVLVEIIQKASFSISAESTSFPIRYQWQVSKDNGETWNIIENAFESSFEIGSVSPLSNGFLYRVVVSNYGGSTISDTVALSVSPKVPEISNLYLNNGDLVTSDRLVNLHYATNRASPTHYRISEDSGFGDTDWIEVKEEIEFLLSKELGIKTLFFQVRNGTAVSEIKTVSISLNQPLIEIGKLVDVNGLNNDTYGSTVRVDGSTIIVGAPNVGERKGKTFIYKRDGGSLIVEAELTANDGVSDDLFGSSVAVWGDVAVVGAPGVSSDTGAAYIFTRNNDVWTQEQKLDGAGGSSSEGLEEVSLSMKIRLWWRPLTNGRSRFPFSSAMVIVGSWSPHLNPRVSMIMTKRELASQFFLILLFWEHLRITRLGPVAGVHLFLFEMKVFGPSRRN